MSPKRSPFSILLVVASAFAWVAGGGVAEAVRAPSSVEVCVDSATGVVSRVASSKGCDGGLQKWSVSQSAPQLCWDGTSLDPVSRTRLVSVAPDSGCVAPLRSVPVGKVVLLCADQVSGVLRWPVTRACETGNANTWVRVGALSNAAPDTTTTTTTTAPSAALVPSVSLQATVIRANTLPKAVIVTANVAGTIYFVEGSVSVKSVKDITNAHPLLWAHGAVAAANTPTAIAIDVDKVLNGYYRVFVMTGQGVLSAPATNIVTISVPRAYETTTTVVSTCLTGGSCSVGVDVGAGGGTVFYYSATPFTSTGSDCGTNCHYLEAAPAGWIVSSTPIGQTNCSITGTSTVDPKCEWSAVTSNFMGSQISPSTAIGAGKSNTAAIVAQAGGGSTAGKAATTASEYRGGSKTDWFLPSLLELNQLCRYAWALTVDNTATTCTGMTGTIRTGFSTDDYWSSTDYNDPLRVLAQFQNFNVGSQHFVSKSQARFVRPVRAG